MWLLEPSSSELPFYSMCVSIYPVSELSYLPAVSHPGQPQWCHTALQVSEAAQHSSWTLCWGEHGRPVREGFQHPAPGEVDKWSNSVPKRDLGTRWEPLKSSKQLSLYEYMNYFVTWSNLLALQVLSVAAMWLTWVNSQSCSSNDETTLFNDEIACNPW